MCKIFCETVFCRFQKFFGLSPMRILPQKTNVIWKDITVFFFYIKVFFSKISFQGLKLTKKNFDITRKSNDITVFFDFRAKNWHITSLSNGDIVPSPLRNRDFQFRRRCSFIIFQEMIVFFPFEISRFSEEAEVLFYNLSNGDMFPFPQRNQDFQKRRRCSLIILER